MALCCLCFHCHREYNCCISCGNSFYSVISKCRLCLDTSGLLTAEPSMKPKPFCTHTTSLKTECKHVQNRFIVTPG